MKNKDFKIGDLVTVRGRAAEFYNRLAEVIEIKTPYLINVRFANKKECLFNVNSLELFSRNYVEKYEKKKIPVYSEFDIFEHTVAPNELPKHGQYYIREEIEIDRNDCRAKYVINGFTEFCDDECKCIVIVYEKDGDKFYSCGEAKHSHFCYEREYKNLRRGFTIDKNGNPLEFNYLQSSPEIDDEIYYSGISKTIKELDEILKKTNTKCDCGAVVAKTTHANWCSTNKIK